MLKRKNINNKSLLELALSESSLPDKDKVHLRNWLDGVVKFINDVLEEPKPEAKNIYREF